MTFKFSNNTIFGIFVILNIILKFTYLNTYDVALDEPFSIFVSLQPVSLIFKITLSGNSLPLYEVLLHYFIEIFGVSTYSVRIPSLLFSSITAGILYLIGSKYLNKNVGVIASILFTLSTMHIYFSHESRVYPLFIMLTTISIYITLGIRQSPNTKKYFILFCTNLLLIYSHYFGWLVLIIEFICYLLYFDNKKKSRVIVTAFICCTLASYLPIFSTLYERLIFNFKVGTWVKPPGITELYGNINRFLNNRIVLISIILLILIQLYLYSKKDNLKNYFTHLRQNTNFKIILIFFLLPYVTMFILSFKTPMFIDRYILFTSIPLYISIAVVLDSLNNNSKIYYFLIALVFSTQLIFMNLKPDNNRRINDVANYIKTIKQPESKVYIAPYYADLSFMYHYNIDIFKDYQNFTNRMNRENIFGINNSEDIQKFNDTKSNNIIFIEAGSEFTDPNKSITKYLYNNYKLVRKKDFFQIYSVYEFEKK